ncbi:MAG: DISARM system SNF2-like helicase DrmD [Bryobacteraceae bacterium]
MQPSLLSPARRLPEPGEIVHVRQRLYLVEQIVKSQVAGEANVVYGACIDDDAQGQPLQVLWEHELDAEIRAAESWNKLTERGFDPPERFAAYLNTLRWNCVTSTDARLLQSPFRAGIRLDAYQLEPLRKALLLPRVNLFIADDVGLGKTIEAGLIARELLLRKKVREIVVSCPPSMLLQWQEELANRFGLQFVILDKEYIRNVRRERGFSVNPWSTHTRFLISHRLLIDEAYTSGLRDWLGAFCPGTLLILDEAHHAAPASGQKYCIDSQITHAVRDLAGRFEHRLFLSATPHNGHSNSFSALLEILDPQRFIRGVPVSKPNRDEVMVRRIKEDLRVIQGGFPERKVQQILLSDPASAPEIKLFSMLGEYQQAREDRLQSESRRAQNSSGLVLCHLQQRLFSSIEAFARTLKVHRRSIERQRQTDAAATSKRIDESLLYGGLGSNDDRASLSQSEIEAEMDSQVEAATNSAPAAPAQSAEQYLLQTMTELAEESRHLPDARVRYLIQWIEKHMCPRGRWNDTRVIIFTEYEDTLGYVKRQLDGAIEHTNDPLSRIATYSGETSSQKEKREEIKKAFNTEPAKHPLRILLATDAAREGLNLQAYCHNLFHFDVPWNPSRMEQRNGRIDRKLQPSLEVFCYYFVYQNRPEDRILQALVRKTKIIREQLGSLSQVIDKELEQLLKRGIRRQSISEVERAIDTAEMGPGKQEAIEDELESARIRQNDVRRSIEQLRSLMEYSRREVGLDDEHFRSAISCSLEMSGAPALKLNKKSLTGRNEYTLPTLDERDSSWIEIMDSLRIPRERDQNPNEWRRSSPIRPIVFEDPGKVTEDVVHFHLEQRVVQRLLSRFLSQGFVHHDLSRACLAQTRDAIPRIILLGRLALYGSSAARLHEEIIPVTARWTDSVTSNSPLQPYARQAEQKTLDLLDKALLVSASPNERIRKNLLASAARDVQQLLPHLHARAEEYRNDAVAKLKARGDDESKKMLTILQAQLKLVQEKELENRQMSFEDWNEEERRQQERDRKRWNFRLGELPAEMKSEPQRIREVYQVKAERVEPIGLIYLWPETN